MFSLTVNSSLLHTIPQRRTRTPDALSIAMGLEEWLKLKMFSFVPRLYEGRVDGVITDDRSMKAELHDHLCNANLVLRTRTLQNLRQQQSIPNTNRCASSFHFSTEIISPFFPRISR